MQAPLSNHTVQHLSFVEAIHHNEPVDDFAVAADREPGRRTHQRDDVPVDVRREAAVELELGPASRLAASER